MVSYEFTMNPRTRDAPLRNTSTQLDGQDGLSRNRKMQKRDIQKRHPRQGPNSVHEVCLSINILHPLSYF